MSITCPVCKAGNTEGYYLSYTGTCITSDMMVLPDSEVNNRLCTACGLIFNSAGTRGNTSDFYKNTYSLMLRSESAAIQSFSGPAPITQAERTYQILCEMIALPERGRLLEAGAGKGEFLAYFSKDFPEWSLSAFEPSASYEVLRHRFPKAHIERCDYAEFAPEVGGLDIVVALGVLEHVENPLDMLQWGHRLLCDGGHFYLRVPNFKNNPNDLFCVDHLSKLTEPTLRGLAVATGFEVVAVKESGVPVFMALKKAAVPAWDENDVVASNRAILKKNAVLAERSMSAVIKGHAQAKLKGEKFAIFGLGSSGLFAPFYGNFPTDDISAYIDENRSMWGGRIHDRPVCGLDMIESLGIRHIALAVSPVYYEQIKHKLAPFGVTVYSAE